MQLTSMISFVKKVQTIINSLLKPRLQILIIPKVLFNLFDTRIDNTNIDNLLSSVKSTCMLDYIPI